MTRLFGHLVRSVYAGQTVKLARASEQVDPLTDLIALLRPRAVLWKRLRGQGEWALRFAANRDVNFGTVLSGRCVLTGAGAPVDLSQGDFLLLTRRRRSPSAAAMLSDRSMATRRCGATTARW